MIRRIAIIPARINSKRIIEKNIKKINQKPLIQITIEVLKKSKFFNKIHISTDSKKIKRIVNKHNLDIDFMRSNKLSKDKTPVADVVNFVLKKYNNLGEYFDEVWLFYVSNPFLNINHINKAYKLYKKDYKKFSIMTVSNYSYPISWAMTINKKKFLTPINGLKKFANKKDILCEAGMFVIYQKDFAKKNVKIKYKPYKIPIWETVDIDTEEDLKLAKKLLINKL